MTPISTVPLCNYCREFKPHRPKSLSVNHVLPACILNICAKLLDDRGSFFSSLHLFCIRTFPIQFQLLLCCMSSNNEEICDFYQFNLKCSFKRHSRIYICLMFLKLVFFFKQFFCTGCSSF